MRLNQPRFIIKCLLVLISISVLLLLWRSSSKTNPGHDDYSNSNLESHIESLDFKSLSQLYPRLNETGLPFNIVPNTVHYVQFDKCQVSFVWYVSILSVVRNHKPEKIIIHTNCDTLIGNYWTNLMKLNYLIKLKRVDKPKYVFGKRLTSNRHASDVIRLKALMEYGGIYLDNDVFVVKSLDEFRKFELTLGWPEGEYLGNQVIIAHKNALFLKLWFDSYRDYVGHKWYFNAGQLPTEKFLIPKPSLVHREMTTFGVQMLVPYLYTENWPLKAVEKKFHTIHLLISHLDYMLPRIVRDFDEKNIWTLNHTFANLARSVLNKS